MSNLKKLFFVAVTVMTVFGVVGYAPTGAKAATAGSLIKMAGNSAVYYFDGTKRFVFPQENVYKSWYKDFSGVQTISQSELQSYPIGGNVTMRPGTWMVKITTDPKVYAVTPGGVLHHVDSEARAIALWGANWNKMIVDVSDAFFVNYSTGTALSSNTHPTGSLIKRGTSYYYVDNGNERPFASDAALTANMMNTAFAVETTMDYPDGSSITGAETALTNVAGSSSSTSTSAAGLTVSGGMMTASTSLPTGANSVKIGSWNFAAGPEGAVTLNQVTFKRTGVGNVSDITNAYIYDGANRLTSGRTFNSSSNETTFTLNLSIPAGSTKVLSLYVSLSTTAAAGDEHVFGIESASKVSSNAASVNGVFPVNSNKHSIAGASAGTLSVSKNGSLSDPRVGDKGYKVSEFKLSAATEDAYVNQITLTQGGNISNSALSNFQLKQNGTLVASASAIASNDRLDLMFSPAFFLEKGNDRVFELYADIGGRPDDTIIFYVEDAADVMATGGTFGVGMTTSLGTDIDGPGDAGLSIQLDGGQFTITFDGPSAQNISNTASDVIIWQGSVYSANEVEIRNWRFNLADGNGTDPDLCDASPYAGTQVACAIQDIKLWNLDNNTVIAGPLDLTAADNLTSQDLTFTDDYTMSAGQTMNIGLSVDVKNNPGGNLSLLVTMGDGTNSFTQNDIKNIGSNTYLSLANGDIVPSSTIAGQTQTVVSASLTVTTAASPTAHVLIKGANADAAGGFNFVAGAGTSVKVNSVQVKVATDDTGAFGGDDGVSPGNLILSAKLMDGATQVGTSKSFTVASNIGTATFDNLNWTVSASQTKRLDVVLTTNSAATLAGGPDDDTLKVYLATGAVSAVDSNGNTITGNMPSSQQNGPLVTVKSSGSLTATLAPTPTNPSAKLLAAGSTDNVLAAFKFEATDESFNVKKFQLITSTAANTARLATAKVRYPTQSNGTQTRVIGLSGSSTDNNIDISDMPMYVAQNGSATLEVLGDASAFTVLDGTESNKTLGFTLKGSDATNNQASGIASNQSVTNYGSNAVGNNHLFVRTVLTAAAGSGTPNNTSRTRSAAQKVASWNLSASSTSNAFVRGSLKATDGTGAAGWSTEVDDSGSIAYSTAQKVSGSGSTLWTASATAAANDHAGFNFGDTTSLQKYSRVSFWVYTNQAVTGGHINLFTNSTDAATATNAVSIGAVSATTWTYVDTAITVNAGSQYAGLYLTATSPTTYNGKLFYIDDFRFYNDSITATVAGNLNNTAPVGLMFYLKDTGGTIRAYGAYNGTNTTGTVKFIAGTGVDVTAVTAHSAIEVSSTALALDVETNTTSLMLTEAGNDDSLSVSVNTGTIDTAGNFVWYDNSDSAGGNDAAGITAVNPLSTTIDFANTY